MQTKFIKVCAAVIVREKRILIAKRRKDAKFLGGLWEFPGGKLEPGESPAQCLAREIAEELALVVEVGPHLVTVKHNYPDFSIELIVHLAHFLNGEPVLVDHDEVAFVEINELENFEFAPADVPAVKKLQGILLESILKKPTDIS